MALHFIKYIFGIQIPVYRGLDFGKNVLLKPIIASLVFNGSY